MNGITLAVLIVAGLILAFILYKLFKPYFLKYDTTLAITGGLGSGKTLTAVKTAVILLRKNRFWKYKIYNFFCVDIGNAIRRIKNKKRHAYNLKLQERYKDSKCTTKLALKPVLPLKTRRKKPMLYSNIPIHFKTHMFSKKREWNKTLTAPHILLLLEIEEYSIVVIDELPQFINQFNWNEELIQKNVNEFITFFRHYIGGYMITTSQSIDDVVVQIRRKLNQCTWCYDFKKHFFGLFYTIRMCDIMLGDQISTVSTSFIEDNTKLHFGMFPPKRTYDSRCYSGRYKNVYKKVEKTPRWKNLKTNKVLRLQKYSSPLDDIRTEEEKQEQWNKGAKTWVN